MPPANARGEGHAEALESAAESAAGVPREVGPEKLTGSGPVPYSVVHATQFFEFVRSIADAATVDGAVHLAPVLFQPIVSDDVARAVASLGETRSAEWPGRNAAPGEHR